MKITVQTTALKAALSLAGKPVKASSTLPVLASVLLEAHVDGGLTISGTDLETRAMRTIGADVTESGAVALPARMFSAFVSELQGGETTISVAANHRATITSDRAEIVLPGQNAEEFPAAMSFDGPSFDFTMAADVFAAAVSSVAHAVAPDDSRPVLAGINMLVRDGTMTLAAADSFQLSVQRIRDLPDVADLNVIVHGRALGGLASVLAGATSVRLAVDAGERAMLVESEAGTWHTRLLEGTFPDFNRIIPRNTPTSFTVNRLDFLAATKLVAPVAKDNSYITRLTLDGSKLSVKATTAQEDAETSVDVADVVGPLSWALNNTYIRNALESLDGQTVTVNVAGVASPTLMHNGDREAGSRIVMAMSTPR